MSQTATLAVSHLADLLRSSEGVNAACAALLPVEPPSAVEIGDILELYAPAELTEKAANVRYPVIHVYCDRIVNSLKEKFRTFSGIADLNIEVRVSHDHLGELQKQVQYFLQGITAVLDSKRGAWSSGMYYPGRYEILYTAVKRGGKNYLQSARVRLEVHINVA